MSEPRILVAGIGNIFLGDDAFGSEVARQLMRRRLPDAVKVLDFGIRGFDLTYALLDRYELTILVDATPRGEAPGTLYKIEPDLDELDKFAPPEETVETHGMDPLKVLRMVKAMGGELNSIVIIGCEPSPLEDETEGQMGLSQPVHASVNQAVEMIETLVAMTLVKGVTANA